MKNKFIAVVIMVAFLLSIFSVILPVKVQALGTTYYVSFSAGNDSNNGTSSTTPWKTLSKISGKTFNAGDQILLKRGDTWNETLELKGTGTSTSPVYLGAFGTGAKPKIAPMVSNAHCIKIINQAGFKIEGLELTDAMTGIYMEYIDSIGYDYIEINDCYIHGMNDNYNTLPNRFNHFSAAVNFSSYHSTWGDHTALTNLKITNSTFDNCNVGFWSGAPWSRVDPTTGFINGGYCMYMGNAVFENLLATNCKQWGYSFQWFKTASVKNCDASNVGWGTNPYGCVGILVGWSRDVVVENSDVKWVYKGDQDFDGIGFDFEGGGNSTQNITYKNSTVEYTDGCGVYFFHNGGVGGTANALLEGCTISYFGQNPGTASGASSEGIKFWDGTSQTHSTGIIRNNVLNRDNSKSFYNGYPSAVNGFTFTNNTYNDVDSPCCWDFGYTYGRLNWGMGGLLNSVNLGISQDAMDLNISGSDPWVMSAPIKVTAAKKNLVRIRMKNNTSSNTGEFYWITSTDGTWNESKKKEFTIKPNDSGYSEYFIDLSDHPNWTGTITRIKFDPAVIATGSCNVDYITIDASASKPEKSWEFSSSVEGWYANSEVSSFMHDASGAIKGNILGPDAQTFSPGNLGMSIADSKRIEIRLKNNTSSTIGEIFFITNADTTWDGNKHAYFTIKAYDTDYSVYTIDMGSVPGWTGTLKQLRIDPAMNAVSGSFQIDFVHIQPTVLTYEFNGGNTEGWTAINQVTGFSNPGTYINGTVTGSDPYIVSEDNLSVDITNSKKLLINLKNSTAATLGEIYFKTSGDTTWSTVKSKSFILYASDSRYSTYLVDMSDVVGWTGTLKQFRVDPEAGISSGSFAIDAIRIIQ